MNALAWLQPKDAVKWPARIGKFTLKKEPDEPEPVTRVLPIDEEVKRAERNPLAFRQFLGGVSFGPKPRDFSFKLPLKIRWLAFRSALTAKYEAGQVSIVDPESLCLASHKTAQLATLLDGFTRPDPSARPRKLLILGTLPPSAPELVNLQRAAQSLDGAQVQYIQVQGDLSKRHKLKQHQLHPVTAYHLIRSHHVCLTPEAVAFYQRINAQVYQ